MAKKKNPIKCFFFHLLAVYALLFSFIQNIFGNDIKIQGYIYNGATYEPLAGAKVELLSQRLSATSDDKGHFILSNSNSISNMNSLFNSALNTQINGTMLSFTVSGKRPKSVSIHATDLSGCNVLLFQGTAAAGNHTLNLNDKLHTAGVYVLHIFINGVRNTATRFITLDDISSAGDIMEKKRSATTKTVTRAATSAQDTLAVSKTGYQTRKVAIKKLTEESLKIRLSAKEGKYHHPAILHQGFTYEKADFRSVHASSIEDLPNGDLVTVYFGGAGEGRPGTVIRFQRKPLGGKWSPPTVLGDASGDLTPCWNPVIYQVPGGKLLFFWKVGPNPSKWWGMMKTSSDHGHTWSKEKKLGGSSNPTCLGPVKNKPVRLKNGDILSPSSRENKGWIMHVERSKDNGTTWEFVTEIKNEASKGAIQPSILTYADGKIQIVARCQGGTNLISSWSTDNGNTWTPTSHLVIPNNNAGIDAVTLSDGRQLLVYNHAIRAGGTSVGPESGRKGRNILNVSVSKDGKAWDAAVLLETTKKDNGRKSYPTIIQSSDGLVHITYTFLRSKVKHVVLNPECFEHTTPMPDGKWPTSGPASMEP